MVWEQRTDSQDHFFASVRTLQVDEAGNIYVLDPKDCQIKIFDKEGKFVQAVSRKGQGPGEIQLPLAMEIAGDDTLVLYDMAKKCFSLFSLSGDFIRQKSAAEYLYLIRVRSDHSGYFIVQTPVRTPEK
ncbi:MAG: 6-bladed beta-propeller [Candidatus Aminicenantaceae bacterium]